MKKACAKDSIGQLIQVDDDYKLIGRYIYSVSFLCRYVERWFNDINLVQIEHGQWIGFFEYCETYYLGIKIRFLISMGLICYYFIRMRVIKIMGWLRDGIYLQIGCGAVMNGISGLAVLLLKVWSVFSFKVLLLRLYLNVLLEWKCWSS